MNGAYQADGLTVLGFAGGHAVPTGAEIAALWTASSGGVIGSIPGKTSRRHDLTADTADAAGKLPAVSVDRMSSGESLTRVGAPLQLAQRTERSWGYESKDKPPPYVGLRFPAVGDHYVATGLPATDEWAAFHVIHAFRFRALSSATKRMLSRSVGVNPASGYVVDISNNNVYTAIWNGSQTAISSTTSVLTAADVDKVLVHITSFSGSSLQTYLRRVAVGTATSYTGHTAYSGPLYIGRDVAGTYPGSGIDWLGTAIGPGALTLAEVQSIHDAVLYAEDVVSAPGRTGGYLWSPKREGVVSAAPDVVTERLRGAASLVRAGAPAIEPNYSHASGW
jgi:hypothetical protein